MNQWNQFAAWLDNQRSLGLLILRLGVGFIIGWSGALKLFVFGFGGVINSFSKMGFFLPQVLGPFIALLEFFGGIAVALGLLTRLLGVLYTIEFLVAFFFVKIGSGYSNFRIDLALIAMAVVLATHGAGAISLDAVLKKNR